MNYIKVYVIHYVYIYLNNQITSVKRLITTIYDQLFV